MNHFIKLPDGMIINVAHVRRVSRPIPNYVYIDTGKAISEDQDNPSDCYDPDGEIYDYFERIAQDIRIANLPVNVELCWKCDKERSNDQDEDCPHCGEMWAPF